MECDLTDQKMFKIALIQFRFTRFIPAIICALTLLSSCNNPRYEHHIVVGGAHPTKSANQVQVKPIDTAMYFSMINRCVDSLDRDTKNHGFEKYDLAGGAAEGGELMVYSNQNDRFKLEAVYYGETGKKVYRLYLKKKELVAAIERTTFYTMPIGIKKMQIDSVVTQSYVFKDGNVISSADAYGKVHHEKDIFKSAEIKNLLIELNEKIDKTRR